MGRYAFAVVVAAASFAGLAWSASTLEVVAPEPSQNVTPHQGHMQLIVCTKPVGDPGPCH